MECAFLAILNLYQSFWGKCQKKFGMAIFDHPKFIPVCLAKIVGKNFKWPILAIPNLYQSFWEKLFEKIWNGHISPFQIYNLYQSFWEKLSERIWNAHFWPF